ncbi:MAG: methionyl-tRNA formyltransferase [Myxococcales bacterium]|nr:methionyl-tRNA formyltransferase [Polyangiaceae bacterium]MDW8248591.1 methionyl-tRNA formyltransferase [Myxococcales bacterium]
MTRPRTLFFGTPALAIPALRALHACTEVVALVCQPDKPVGRDPTPQPPPTKRVALELGIPVHQPVKVKTPEFAAWVRDQKVDAAVVLAYGRILTREVLEAPRLGCLNLHASLLPKYRGAAPIQWSIVHGETETGISLMQMDEGIDTGPVLAMRRLPIGPEETAEQLTERMADLAAEVVRTDFLDALAGKLSPIPQDHSAATLAPILTREHGRVDWSRSAQAVHDHIRGFYPWPGAYTTGRGKTLKLLEARVVREPGVGGVPGLVLAAPRGKLWIACGQGVISLERGQLEGKKALSGEELLRGRAVQVGDRLG